MTQLDWLGVGDLIWASLDPTIGREQQGWRPALVVSAMSLHAKTGFIIVAPITSRVRPFPTSVVLPAGLSISGEVLLNQVRSIDTLARPIRRTGERIQPELAGEVGAKLAMLLSI